MIKPITNDHSGAWHQEKFLAFARAKAAINEPTPHMGTVTYLAAGRPLPDQVWLAGAYLAAYSVLTGEAVEHYWPRERVAADPDGLLPWLRENWGGIHTRKPRRCVRTPEKMARCLKSVHAWGAGEFPRLAAKSWDDPRAEYDEWWTSANRIDFFGRYVSIRLLELMRRWGHMRADLYDIRAVGAHSPIRCLMLLRPDRVDDLMTGDPLVVNQVAAEVLADLRGAGSHMSYFTFATLLCEYRANYESSGDYAGNQHDEELEYSLSRYADHWRATGLVSRLYEARAATDPLECLGEVQGWKTRRLDVAAWLRTRGVVWSDLEYDYLRSRAAGAPVERMH
jgi:hypothetical protein